jgi:hypothetical protein
MHHPHKVVVSKRITVAGLTVYMCCSVVHRNATRQISDENLCTGTHTRTHTHTHTHIHTYIYACMHACIHTYILSVTCLIFKIYKHTRIKIYIHTFIHSFMHTYIHIYIHTYNTSTHTYKTYNTRVKRIQHIHTCIHTMHTYTCMQAYNTYIQE